MSRQPEQVPDDPSEPEPDTDPSGEASTEEDGDLQDGLFDRMADAEVAIEAIGPKIEDIGKSLQLVMNILAEGMTDVPNDGTFAARLRALRNLAERLAAPAVNFESETAEFKASLSTLDTSLSTLVHITADEKASPEVVRSALETADSLDQFRNSVLPSLQQFHEFKAVLRELNKMSRDMREPSKHIEQGLTNFLDALDLTAEWADDIRRQLG